MKCKVLIREDKVVGHWVARGLDYDICAQGNSIKSAIENLCELIYLEYKLSEHLREKFEDRIPKAPQHLWDIYNEKYKNIHSTELPDFPLDQDKDTLGTLSPHLVTA